MRSMKVALVHDFLDQFGGAERVLIELTKIFPQAPIYTLFCRQSSLPDELKNKKIVVSRLQKNPQRPPHGYRLLLSRLPAAIEQFDFSDYDLIISDSSSFAKGVVVPGKLHISYCHTPTRYLWDWRTEFIKEHKLNEGIKGLVSRFIFHKLRIWDSIASQRADYIIANSLTVKRRIKRFYGRVADSVIYPPVETKGTEPTPILAGGYYLTVGRLSPYKRFDLAVRAVGELGGWLKVVGVGSEYDNLVKLAKNYPAAKIQFLGRIGDEQLKKVYRGAKAMIFPAEDDFGIVPIESLAWGRPVIALKKGGVCETLKEGETGFFFQEPDVELTKCAILKFEANFKQFDPKKLHQIASQYDSAAFRKKILAAIKRWRGIAKK